jgi:hypothetical protein
MAQEAKFETSSDFIPFKCVFLAACAATEKISAYDHFFYGRFAT